MNKITKQFLMTCIILTGTISVANAQVTVAESATVESGASSNGDMHYNETQNTIAKDGKGGTAVIRESVSHDHKTNVVDDNEAEVTNETVPTGAVKSSEIRRTETGRTVRTND